ncbi:MAG: glycosyltransferase family 39 protein [Candidatus Latescibacteria bacterium]|nr:glycosyltransferase family 39 protein [Candidatus Latescibacterota bacterium]
MSKKKRRSAQHEKQIISDRKYLSEHIPWPGLITLSLYTAIACILTFPLIFRMNSSVYGFYDHITTDLFAAIHYYFWWMKEAIVHLKTSPMTCPIIAAPFGSRMIFTNFTGFAQLPITIVFGHLFSRNFAVLFNLIVSGLGVFYLVRHITKNSGAGIIAGIVFAFCPNMMVRSYTTFDSTQVQWIPFYTYFLLKFIEHRTWKNAVLSGVFLLCNILFAMPYFLVYLPVHTIVILITLAVWHAVGKKRGFDGLLKDLTTQEAIKAWIKTGSVLAVLIVIFGLYYSMVIGGQSTLENVQRTKTQLSELSLKPLDYLVPHPRSALFKGNFKASYWDAVDRPEKNSDSNVAYIGYIALGLTVLGLVKGKSPFKWVFLAGAVVAFWSTMGPSLFGIPTPSGLIHTLYAPFARRILIYKVFVQLPVAVLAGMGASFLLHNTKKNAGELLLLVGLPFTMLLEYAIVPPALSVDLSHNPEVYEHVHDLPEGSGIIEVPLRREVGHLYQGYLYYQTVHGKALFNPYMGLGLVPERIQPFYRQMEVPMEAQEYCNLAALRYLGISHLVYHHIIATRSVIFRAFIAPGFEQGDINGLKQIFKNELDPAKGEFQGPFDYTFADLYEITAEPSPVALTFDYNSPYDRVPGATGRDGLISGVGWYSAFFDPNRTFYVPWTHLEKNEQLIRMLRQGGKVTATNLSDEPVDFSIRFVAESDDEGRELVVKWNDGPDAGNYVIGPDPVTCEAGPFHIDGGSAGELSIWSKREVFKYGPDSLATSAILSDFRVLTGKIKVRNTVDKLIKDK